MPTSLIRLSMPVTQLGVRASEAALTKNRQFSENLSAGASVEEQGSGVVAALTPSEDDYVYADFRALSAVSIPGRGVNFEKAGVLKKSVPLLLHQTVYRDHRVNVDNWAGLVMQSKWSNKGPGVDGDGPPGVNVELRIDAVQAPSIARGLLSDPPTLHSVSVGVEFEWEKSHPDMDDFEFWWNLGDTHKDGRLIEKVATKILAYHEISMVYQGADPNAKRILGKGGKPCGVAKRAQSLGLQEGDEHMDYKVLIAKLLGIDPDTSDEVLMAAFDKRREELSAPPAPGAGTPTAPEWLGDIDEQAFTALQANATKATELETKVTELTATIEPLKANAALGEKFLKQQREEALRLFKLVEGDVTEPITQLLSNANLETAQAYVDLYAKKAEAKFHMSCSKCGSTEVSRQSSTPTNPEDGSKTELGKNAPATDEKPLPQVRFH